jgi:hypothetical protein
MTSNFKLLIKKAMQGGATIHKVNPQIEKFMIKEIKEHSQFQITKEQQIR